MFLRNPLRLLAILIPLLFQNRPIAAASAPDTPVLWIEAERFVNPGGWTNDSQFIDQMGSPYLLAAGMGQPVADAITTVKPPAPGRYRLWARTRDWSPQHHPGRFELSLNGKSSTLGATGKTGWVWEDCGIHELAGPAELRLHDLTGYYGRCDAMALAADLNWTPPADKDAIAVLRERLGGLSREVKEMGEWDVVVVGGGLAGCMAAVSAARMGAHTALIQDRPVLGGNGSTEVLVPPVGITNSPAYKKSPLDPRETGLIEEVRMPGLQKTPEVRVYSSRLRRLVALEPNLDLFLNTHATGALLQPGRKDKIAAVSAVSTTSGLRMRFGGRLFIDCTGDGVIGVAAGAEWRQGRESRAEFGEDMAPEVANTNTMGNSLKFVPLPAATDQPFTTPSWALTFHSCDDFPIKRHPPQISTEVEWQWMLELGGMGDPYKDKEETRDELLRLIYGIWAHIKNGCPKLNQQAARYKLGWVETVVGVRESRRLIGDYVFRQDDVTSRIMHPDRIAYGAWGLDDHPSDGFFNRQRYTNHQYHGIEHSIPYRILYSKNIGNLMMAGRDVSATHVGMGTTRVQITCALMGMAAGTAAAMCIENQTTPRGIYQHHIAELQQQLLKDGAFIIDLPNRDPRDLALQATVRASSETTTATGKGEGRKLEKLAAAAVIDGVARARLDSLHAWEADKKAPGPHWIELSWEKPQSFNMVHVTFFRKDLAARRFTVQAWVDGMWKNVAEFSNPGIFRRCLAPLRRTTTNKLRVALDQPSGICEIRVYDEPERILEIARRAGDNMRQPEAPDALFPWEKP